MLTSVGKKTCFIIVYYLFRLLSWGECCPLKAQIRINLKIVWAMNTLLFSWLWKECPIYVKIRRSGVCGFYVTGLKKNCNTQFIVW